LSIKKYKLYSTQKKTYKLSSLIFEMCSKEIIGTF
jgi:hypothetical protein